MRQSLPAGGRQGVFSSRSRRTLTWAGLAAGPILVQALFEAPAGSIFWSTAFDAGHTVLFGIFAVALLRLSRLLPERVPPRPASRLGPVVLAVTVMAGLTEWAQSRGTRQADPRDFARDLMGATAGLLISAALDRRTPTLTRRVRARRTAMLVTATVLLAAAFFQVAGVTRAFIRRNRAFPRICDFGSTWGDRFIRTRDATLTRTEPPAGWGRDPSVMVGRVVLHPAIYPAVAVTEPCPDWTGYGRLVFDVYLPSADSLRLAVRIDDRHHNEEYDDRFNMGITIRCGPNHVVLSMDEIRDAPRSRRMDLAHMRSVTLFTVSPAAPCSLYLDAIRLEVD